jgi:hypothetical protein
MTNEVTELLSALQDGSMTLDEVADRFRVRKWPRHRPPADQNYLDRAAAELKDPDLYVPGSFDDVVAAYDQQKISREQFRVLGRAAAEAQRAEDEQDEG